MAATIESLTNEVASLSSALRELLNRVPAPLTSQPAVAVGPAYDYSRYPEGPRVTEVMPNVRLNLVAPVCPGWEPGFYATIFGRDFNPNDTIYPVAGEPSNAKPDQQPRSPSGYPLHYRNDGTVLLMNADGFFPNEMAVEAEREQRRIHNERAKAEWGTYRPGGA